MPTIIMRKGYLLILKNLGSVKMSRAVCRGLVQLVICGEHLGYVYNPKYVSREDAEDWGLLLNQKYYKKITAKDSVRDCYFAVRGMQTQKEILTKKFQNQSNYKEKLSSLLNDTSDQSIQMQE